MIDLLMDEAAFATDDIGMFLYKVDTFFIGKPTVQYTFGSLFVILVLTRDRRDACIDFYLYIF